MTGELGDNVREYARRVAAAAPALNPEQRLRLATLLRPSPLTDTPRRSRRAAA